MTTTHKKKFGDEMENRQLEEALKKIRSDIKASRFQRVTRSENVNEVVKALAAATLKFATVVKDAKVNAGSRRYTYATLKEVIAATREPLASNGLIIQQTLGKDEKGGLELESTLYHESGQWLRGYHPCFQEKNFNASQGLGSGHTYARRYGMLALLNLAAEDDDGQGGPQGGGQTSKDYNRTQNQNIKKQSYRAETRTPEDRLKDYGLTVADINVMKARNNVPPWEQTSDDKKEELLEALKSGFITAEHIKAPKPKLKSKAKTKVEKEVKKVLNDVKFAPPENEVDVQEESIKSVMAKRRKERKAGKKSGNHHPSFNPVEFAVTLKNMGYSLEPISAWAEIQTGTRPSSWTHKRRIAFLDKIVNDEIKPPKICKVKETTFKLQGSKQA